MFTSCVLVGLAWKSQKRLGATVPLVFPGATTPVLIVTQCQQWMWTATEGYSLQWDYYLWDTSSNNYCGPRNKQLVNQLIGEKVIINELIMKC